MPAAICIRLERASDDWKGADRKRRASANRKRSEAAKARPREDNGTLARAETSPVSPDTALAETMTEPKRQHVELAAKAHVSTPTAARVQALSAGQLVRQLIEGLVFRTLSTLG